MLILITIWTAWSRRKEETDVETQTEKKLSEIQDIKTYAATESSLFWGDKCVTTTCFDLFYCVKFDGSLKKIVFALDRYVIQIFLIEYRLQRKLCVRQCFYSCGNVILDKLYYGTYECVIEVNQITICRGISKLKVTLDIKEIRLSSRIYITLLKMIFYDMSYKIIKKGILSHQNVW